MVGCVSVRPAAEARDAAGRGESVLVGEQTVFAQIAGEGEPLVLLHGFGASSYSWREVLPDLARDYRVVALDLNGFGYTDRPKEREHYTREGQVQMILATLDVLGIDSAHFVGHSYGGALTFALTAKHPERVRSMILVDPASPEYPTKRRKWFAGARPITYPFVRGVGLRYSFVERVFKRAYLDEELVTPELVEEYRDRLRIEGMAHAYRQLTRPRKGSPSPEVRYEDLHVPALVVWGDSDALVTAEEGLAHASRLPDYRFVTIENSGHSPMEERPDEFLAVVHGFLDELLARGVDGDPGLSATTHSGIMTEHAPQTP